METQVRTPQAVFMQPQRLVVPLFQRPYVWNEEEQWEPLWDDVVRVAERILTRPQDRRIPHFLGAVVLQQLAAPTGLMQQRTIIDGQQRLTTLQLLLDALHAALMEIGETTPALRIDALVTNAEPFRVKPEDRFKVWPTNRDRSAFNAVMGAPPPVAYDELGFAGDRMVGAHAFFSAQARAWLALQGKEGLRTRALAIETTVRDLLQMVVIDLGAEENAQEIFETLNARGAQLTAADLIKNFVFQRLSEEGADVEAAYETSWKEFESAFWEAETTVGRLRYQRSSVFLNQWLIARTGEEIVAREVFSRFKSFATDTGEPMRPLLGHVRKAADAYRRYVDRADARNGTNDNLGLFGYRTGVLESEVVKPLIICLLDPQETPVPDAQADKAVGAIESWMVRRMLLRQVTKAYNKIIAEMITGLRRGNRAQAGDWVVDFLRSQSGESQHWPDDEEVREGLRDLQVYRRLSRARTRMVLEAIEDHLRGFTNAAEGLGGQRVARGLAIEHVMPRKWQSHWPLAEGITDYARDQLLHTLGNLTLLTGKLNSKVSNGPWIGSDGKRAGLTRHDTLFLNRDLVRDHPTAWTESAIRSRTEAMTNVILQSWPAPEGHKSSVARSKIRARHKIDLLDLLNAGVLQGGQTLTPRVKQHASRVGTILSDGQIDIEGKVFGNPSRAATFVTGKGTNGWWFFLVDPLARRSLRDVWRDYVDGLSVDVDDDEAGGGDADDD